MGVHARVHARVGQTKMRTKVRILRTKVRILRRIWELSLVVPVTSPVQLQMSSVLSFPFCTDDGMEWWV